MQLDGMGWDREGRIERGVRQSACSVRDTNARMIKHTSGKV